MVDIRNAVPVTTSEDPATTRWSLSDPMDVLVKMTSPSPATDGDKVGPEWEALTQLVGYESMKFGAKCFARLRLSNGCNQPVGWAALHVPILDEDTEALRESALSRPVIGMQAQACPPPLTVTLGWLPKQLLLKSGF